MSTRRAARHAILVQTTDGVEQWGLQTAEALDNAVSGHAGESYSSSCCLLSAFYVDHRSHRMAAAELSRIRVYIL